MQRSYFLTKIQNQLCILLYNYYNSTYILIIVLVSDLFRHLKELKHDLLSLIVCHWDELSLLSIESDIITSSLTFDEVIETFSAKKARKKCVWNYKCAIYMLLLK